MLQSESRFRFATLVGVWITCAWLVSCTSMDTTSIEDYIGAAHPGARPRRIVATQPATLAAATQPASQPATTMPSIGPLRLATDDAILMSLENNRSLAVERTTPQIKRTQEQIERAAFDPVLAGQVSLGRTRTEKTDPESTTETSTAGDARSAEAALREFLPTGTDVGLGLSTSQDRPDDADRGSTSRVELSVTQALLRGAGIDVNLVSLRQARIDTLSSQYELRGFAQDLVARVEETYWDCTLAQRQIEIVEKALTVAQDQYEEARQYVRVGKLAETELSGNAESLTQRGGPPPLEVGDVMIGRHGSSCPPRLKTWATQTSFRRIILRFHLVAAEAEVALRRENLINARSRLQTTRLEFLRLLNPADGAIADRQVELQDLPTTAAAEQDAVEAHVQLALRMRPDLNQARLLVQRGELELVRTRNGLLPKLDLFITLGKTGYAESFGQSVHDIGDRNYDLLVGVRGEFPVINREARARNQRATLDRDQAMLALDNLSQLAEVDVRWAYIELRRSEEEVRATTATRRLQEEKLRAETEKLRFGKSTLLLVGQVQRDLLSSQVSEVQAVVSYLKAVIELYRLEGSLLDRRGIACPGAEPVDTTRWPG